jgi:predicted chitinase
MLITIEQLRAIMPNLTTDKATTYLPYLNNAMIEGEINTPLRIAAFVSQLAHESAQLKYFEELASGKDYEGRKDLGNIKPGDGVRYKGRGPIQLTGRANYHLAGVALGIDLINNPTRASDPSVAFRIAIWFWFTKKLNELADEGKFDSITKKINGGFNGKADRDRYYQKALKVLSIN